MPPNNNEPDTNDLTADMEVLFEALPAPVREFLQSPARDELARELTAKYQLHIDQAGIFEREMYLMLLGTETPEEFAQSLAQDAGLPQETINALTTDLNQRVFMPIRARMQAGEEERAPAPAPYVPPAQPPAWTQPAPVAPTPPPPPVRQQPISYAEPLPPARQSAPPANLPGTDISRPINPPPAASYIRTMQGDLSQMQSARATAPRTAPAYQPPQSPAAPIAPMNPAAYSAPDPTRPWLNQGVQAPPPAAAPAMPQWQQVPQPAAAPQYQPAPKPSVPQPAPRPATNPWPAAAQTFSAAPSVPPLQQTPRAAPPPNPLSAGYGVDPYRETPE